MNDGEDKNYPGWVCYKCGIRANDLTCIKKYGKPADKKCFDCSTGLLNAPCDICGEVGMVIPSRDFFYPDFELLKNEINETNNNQQQVGA